MNRKKLCRLMLGFCWVARYEPETLAEATALDRMVVVGEALLLLLVAGASGVAWTCFWSQFLPMWKSVCLGSFSFGFIILLDQAIGSSDWRLTGILADPANKISWGNVAKLAVRVGVSIAFSFATAMGATMAICHDAIKSQLEETRREVNQQIEDRYGRLIQDLINRTYGGRIADVKAAKENIAQVTVQLDAARRRQTDAESARKIATEEAERELKGHLGYRKGAGTEFRGRLRDKQLAETAIAKATTEISTIFEPRLKEATDQLAEVSKSLRAAEVAAQGKVTDLEAEKRSKLVPERQDALMSFMALRRIYLDPNLGEAAHHFTSVITGVLLAVELSYVMVRVLFAHASIYMALLIAKYKLESEKVSGKYEVASGANQQEKNWELGPRSPLPPLRIISAE